MAKEALDPAVIAAFPRGCSLVSVRPHGKTRWSCGYKVEIQLDRSNLAYFVKIISHPNWVAMGKAEFEAQTAVANVVPEHALAPYACGTFDEGNQAFFITSFLELEPILEWPVALVDVLKKLHQTSVSPTGKFGFHTNTFCGPAVMVDKWTDNWEEFFIRQFRSDLLFTKSRLAPDSELDGLAERFIDKVIPRLLRPLQTGGRNIKPSLCHGDIYDGNVQQDTNTGQLIIFDSCAFYGHNEMDLQATGDSRYVLGMDFVNKYREVVGASEPQEDFYDRHKLYTIRCEIIVAAMCPEQVSLVQKAKSSMRLLIDKFPLGYEGFAERNIDA